MESNESKIIWKINVAEFKYCNNNRSSDNKDST